MKNFIEIGQMLPKEIRDIDTFQAGFSNMIIF